MPTVALVSFRLGGADGVSTAAARWADGFRALGWRVRTVAGAGPVDVLVPGLAWGDGAAVADPTRGEVAAALAGCDLVVVENLCSLPLHRAASEVVAGVLAGRSAIQHHHDLPWQRARFADDRVPTDRCWLHVVTSDLSRRSLADVQGVEAIVEPLRIDVASFAAGDRDRARAVMGVARDERLVLQPTRAIARKGVPTGVALAEAIGAIYWLTGPAEEGYQPALDRLLGAAAARGVRTLRRLPEEGADALTMADAYAACDAVAFPSAWEGFGIPLLEAAAARRPLVLHRYPVAEELAERHGFTWIDADAPDAVAALEAALEPTPAAAAALEANAAIVAAHFDVAGLPARLQALLDALPTA